MVQRGRKRAGRGAASGQVTEATMKRVSQAELRTHLGKYMHEVRKTRFPLHVVGRNGRGVVILPTDEYEGLIETLHLLGSPANSARLFRSIAEADAGETVELDI